MLQLRVTTPPERTADVRALLERDPGTAHLAVLPGVGVTPPGDLVLADVARESADQLVAGLRALGVDEDGGIVMVGVDAVSRSARRAEEQAPGEGADAVVWEQVVRQADAGSSLSVSYLAFLTIATLLAAIAIVNDSAILLIGAMVLGPEFAPLAALALAALHRRGRLARKAVTSLLVGFGTAIVVTALAVVAGAATGWFGAEVLTAFREQTGFVTAPDRWSVAVAVLAGTAGVLSVTSSRSGALVGVFISVTTVPAAADMAISAALGGGTQFVRASSQLGINALGLLAGALATLAVQRAVWHRVPRAAPRPDRSPPGA